MKSWDREFAALARAEDNFRRISEQHDLRLHHFGDPSNHVEFESELRRREAVKKAQREQRKGKTG